jgi:hypothetical protein
MDVLFTDMHVCFIYVQESARKQIESQVADENRRIALAKSLERQQQRQTEAAEIRQQMQQVRKLGSVTQQGCLRVDCYGLLVPGCACCCTLFW